MTAAEALAAREKERRVQDANATLPSANRPKRSCRLCGKVVRYRNSDGGPSKEHSRYTFKHKCEHGYWCRAGEPLTGRAHSNICCLGAVRSTNRRGI